MSGNGSTNVDGDAELSNTSRPAVSTSTPRRVIACVRCRQRKVRCDGSLPACVNCSKVGVECFQGVSSSKISRARLHFLENRVRELESRSQSRSDTFIDEDDSIDVSRSPPIISSGDHLINKGANTRTGQSALFHEQNDGITTASSNEPAKKPTNDSANTSSGHPVLFRGENNPTTVPSNRPANEPSNESANTSTGHSVLFRGQNDPTNVPSSVPPPPVHEGGPFSRHQHVMHTESPMTQSSTGSAPTSITRDQPLAHEVGLLSLANSSDPKYLGPSSGVPFARLMYESAPQSQGLSLQDWSQTFCSGDTENRGPGNAQPADLPQPAECHQYAEAYFEVAIFLPFMMRNEVFDLLDEVRAFQETGAWKSALPITLGFAQAFLLLSLGARLLETKFKTDFNSAGLLAAGMRYATQVQLYDSTEGIQVLLLMTLNSFYNPEGLNAWYILHTIIASCLDLGLQRSSHRNRDIETTEQRFRRHKRSAIFWSAYSLDRILTTILGRPLTLRDEAIDVEFPGIDETNEVDWGALQWNQCGAKVPESFVPCIYALRFDRIVAEVKLMIYRVSQVPQRFPWPGDLGNWQLDIEKSCQILIQDVESRQRSLRMPDSPYLSLVVVQKLQLKYHSCLMLLYRPSPQIPRPSQDAVRKCFDSAMEIIRISADLNRFKNMDCTWVAAHSIFIAAIAILYCLWTSPIVMMSAPRETCFERVKKAQQLLESLGSTWSVAHNASEKLERLIPVAMDGFDSLYGVSDTRTQLQDAPVPLIRPEEFQDNTFMNSWSQHGVNALVDELGMMREFFDLDWLDDAALPQWG